MKYSNEAIETVSRGVSKDRTSFLCKILSSFLS